MKKSLFLFILFSANVFAIDPYTLIMRQYDSVGSDQLSIPVTAPYESAYLWYNPATNKPDWNLATSLNITSTQITDSSSIGRSLITVSTQSSARAVIGAGISNFDGTYSGLTGQPTNLNQFTNGPGFITSTTAPVTSVNTLTGTVTITASGIGAAASSHTHTASQISDSTTTGRAILTATNSTAVNTLLGIAAQVNSDWSASTGIAQILNKPAKYTGTTNGSGIYTVTYGSAYGSKPMIVFAVEGGTNKDTALLTSTTTTGFSILVERRSDVLGLLPTYAIVSGATVNVIVTP